MPQDPTSGKIKTGEILRAFEQKQLKKKLPDLRKGDTVKVYARVKEGEKERVQVFEGIVMRLTQGCNRTAVTVRKISFGVGVERIFPIHSPAVEKIERIAQGRVRRARLYYLRKRKGKAARVESQLTSGGVESSEAVAAGPSVTEVSEKKESASAEVASIRKGS